MYDVVIIGGGPAGLSAAVILGRCRRRVLVIDSGLGRNRWAVEMHGFLTRDGIAPGAFREAARAEAEVYGVKLIDGQAEHAEQRSDGTFRVRYHTFKPGASGTAAPAPAETATSRKLLLATGMKDVLPKIARINEFYGSSVHHCPYCDGWEHRDERLAAYGRGDAAVGLALLLSGWSAHVTACTDGVAPGSEMRRKAASRGIRICEERVVGLKGEHGRLQRVTFVTGSAMECDGLFFNTDQLQRSDLPRVLGCSFKEDGGVRTDNRQCTGVAGLYLAGDADKEVQFVVVAAAEGATAAVAINGELNSEHVETARSPD